MQIEQANNTEIAAVAWLTFLTWLGMYIHTPIAGPKIWGMVREPIQS